MRWIYLSPHFDDAVLSCGGLIWEQTRAGTPVEIWTIFAGYPPPGPLSDFAMANHKLWATNNGEETVAMRKVEDEQATGIVGADLVHFDIPDCIYRLSPAGEYLYTETVLASPHPADRGLSRRIATVLKSEVREDDTLICPLTLGSHVDHVLARRAAESLHKPLKYYADIPYLLNKPQTLAPAIARLEGELFNISAEGLNAWLEGVGAYKSQLDSLYKGDGTLYDAIRRFCTGENGIRLWHIH
jgi:LmbE family N-acetylglucosaminyl deacetylase